MYPNPEWFGVILDGIREKESGGRDRAVGDGGRSRGAYQIGALAWKLCNGREPWAVWAHEPSEARLVAYHIVCRICTKLRAEGRELSFLNIWNMYRFGGF